jgi:hypothetical protein
MDLMCVLESIAAIDSKCTLTTKRALTAVSRERDRDGSRERERKRGCEALIMIPRSRSPHCVRVLHISLHVRHDME